MSHWVRFVRASGKYQFYGRPHGATVYHLGDDRWQDEAGLTWRDGRNRKVPSPGPIDPSDTICRYFRSILGRC